MGDGGVATRKIPLWFLWERQCEASIRWHLEVQFVQEGAGWRSLHIEHPCCCNCQISYCPFEENTGDGEYLGAGFERCVIYMVRSRSQDVRLFWRFSTFTYAYEYSMKVQQCLGAVWFQSRVQQRDSKQRNQIHMKQLPS